MSDAWVNKRQSELVNEIELLSSQVTRSIDVVEHAKIVRIALKEKFPLIKFKVKTQRFAGGNSVTVYHIGELPHSIKWRDISDFVNLFDGYRGDLMDSCHNVGFLWNNERLKGATFCTYNHGI